MSFLVIDLADEVGEKHGVRSLSVVFLPAHVRIATFYVKVAALQLAMSSLYRTRSC